MKSGSLLSLFFFEYFFLKVFWGHIFEGFKSSTKIRKRIKTTFKTYIRYRIAFCDHHASLIYSVFVQKISK